MELVTFALSVLLTLLFVALAIPFILLGLVAGGFLWALGHLLVLPFRLLGGTIHVGAGVLVFFVKVFLVLAVGFACLLAVAIGFLPVLPILLIALGLWLLFRPSRRQRQHPAV